MRHELPTFCRCAFLLSVVSVIGTNRHDRRAVLDSFLSVLPVIRINEMLRCLALTSRTLSLALGDFGKLLTRTADEPERGH